MAAVRAPRYSDSIDHPHLKGSIMNVLKHMEGVFVVSLAMCIGGAWLFDGQPAAQAGQLQAAAADTAEPMTVVVITGKKMSAEEKQQYLRKEREIAAVREVSAGKG
jgi:hypothetical protein